MDNILGYTFREPQLLEQSLRHSSVKEPTAPSNERMEFLGDAILGMVISEMLYQRFPDKEEGELTLIKSEVVSRPILAELGRAYQLDQLIKIGKGIKQIPESILANVLESLLAAVYLDGGLTAVNSIIVELFSRKIDEVANQAPNNYKALLQHYTQRELSLIPNYKMIKTSGPAHEPLFEVTVQIGGKEYGRGTGKTKKQAEQVAAHLTLKQLNLINGQ